VLRAAAGLPPRLDLRAVAQVAAQPSDVLVVDALHLLEAEGADLATGTPRARRPETAPVAASAATAIAIAIAITV